MLIYSKEPLNVMMKNILLLDDPLTDGYVYVSKETYDQALSLNLTFNGDVSRVKGTISGKGMLNWANNKGVNHAVNLCAEKFTSPLNMLAPYLAYTVPMGIEWSDDNEEIAKMAYGVLHQMSQFINFHATALMPAGAKADITIPKNIIMAYEDSWKAQIATLGECVVAVPIYVNGHTEQPMLEPVADQKAPTRVASFAEQVRDLDTNGEDVNTEVNQPKQVIETQEVDESSESNNESVAEVGATKDAAEVVADDTSEDTGKNEEAVAEESSGESAESESEEESGEESEEDDMEAKILAMMKEIENAPAERFAPKEEPKSEPAKTDVATEPKQEEVKYGESGSINLTEAQIADGNRRLLNDYDI